MLKKCFAISCVVVLLVLGFSYYHHSWAVAPTQDPKPDPDRSDYLRKVEAMKELRETGSTSRMTQEEIDDFIEGYGIPKNHPKFIKYPTCVPKKIEDVCGVKDQWVVKLKHTVTNARVKATVEELLAKYNVQLRQLPTGEPGKLSGLIGNTLIGAMFFIDAPEEIARQISQEENVRYVSQNQIGIVQQNGYAENEPLINEEPLVNKRPLVNKKPLVKSGVKSRAFDYTPYYWLDRVDQQPLLLNSQFNRPNQGSGVDIYIYGAYWMTGHQEFYSPPGGNRNVSMFTYFSPLPSGPLPVDCYKNPHDTAVASLAAGSTVGVASNANLVGIAVYTPASSPDFNETNFNAGLMAIKDRILANRPRSAIVVITLQRSNPPTSLDDNLNAIFDTADTMVVVAAGQYGSAATLDYSYWPLRVPRVLKVGYSNANDKECSMNNGGSLNSCNAVYWTPEIEIFAPGHNTSPAVVVSCPPGPYYDYYYTNSFSGSSAAAPVVGGVGALFLAANKTFWPHWYQVEQALLQMATPGVISTRTPPTGVSNRLVYDMINALPVSVNSASYKERSSRDSLATAFGQYTFVPNRVFLNFEGSGEVECQFLSATSGQVNFAIPTNTPLGTHAVKVYKDAGLLGYGAVRIDQTAPGFFTSNGLGNGLVSGLLYKFNKTTGALEEQVALTASGTGTSWTSNQDAYLILFGTGVRYATSTPTLSVGSTMVNVIYYQGATGYVGLDQINAGPLPDSLKSSGVKSLVLTATGVQSQPNVTVTFAQ